MDLTNLSRAKSYLQGSSAANAADPLVAQLISRASDVAVQFTGRNFKRAAFANQPLNGTGTTRLMLPVNPIIAVTDLWIYSRQVPAAVLTTDYGYQFDDKFLYLCGGAIFCRDLRNVRATYSAGFVTKEDGTVPSGNSPQITPTTGNSSTPSGSGPANTAGPAIEDLGVAYTANGASLAKVTGAPADGQYAFANGAYSFNTAQANQSVTMTYTFSPGSVEQAVLELVGLKIKQRDQFGISSRSLDRETITYDAKSIPESVKDLLNPYRFVVSP